MKYMKYIMFTFLISIIGIASVFANTIYSIDVTLKLDEYGNGYVTEVWDAKVDKGTELYKPMGDLGNSKITNYEVSMDGKKYTYVSSWDVDASKSEKAYKNGINYTNDGFELCFGMSNYGRHKYTLTYNVSNMVYNVEDSQFLYWKFINDSMNPAPSNVSVKVVGPFEFPSVNENVETYENLLDAYIADINNKAKNEDLEITNFVAPETESVKCNKVLFDDNKVSAAYDCKVKGSKYTYEYYDYLGSTVSLADSVAVWGYGYNGYAYVSDGAIEMINEENNFDSSEYVVLLARFKKDTFKTTNTYSEYNDFGDVYGRSKEGSFRNDTEVKFNFFTKLISVIITLFPFIFTLGIGLLIALFAKSGSYDKGTVDIKNANPFRDIPCNKDVLDAYFLSKVYNLYKKKEDLFGAVILKWVLDGTVKIKEEEKQGVFKTKKIISLDMTCDYQDDTPYGKLYNILKVASKDGILESNELEKYCTNHYDKLYSWFDEVENFVKNKHLSS